MIETSIGAFTLVQFLQTDAPIKVDWHSQCWWCMINQTKVHQYLRHRVQYQDGSRALPEMSRPKDPCRLLICETHMNDVSIPRALQLATVAARLHNLAEVE